MNENNGNPHLSSANYRGREVVANRLPAGDNF
jgi:hypothetical protein